MTPQRWRALLLVVMVTGVLFAVRPLASRLNPETLFLHSDKLFHVLYFAGLWMLARRAGIASGWSLALCLLGYGVGVEVAQHLVPTGRSASLADVGADTIGIALGGWLTRRSVGQPQKDRR